MTGTGTAIISIITRPTSQVNTLESNVTIGLKVSFAGVPLYLYTAQRATNATFTGTLQTWPVQAWADGSIYVWDDFADLTNRPPQAFYRLSYP